MKLTQLFKVRITNKRLIRVLAAIVGIILIVFSLRYLFSTGATAYQSDRYPITFQYPENWVPKDGYEERIGKKDAFVQIGAQSNKGATIDDMALAEAFHNLKPYGSQPKISNMTLDGQEARLILPSDDQKNEMQSQAAIIMRAPKPFKIEETEYNFLIVWTDSAHISEISKTIQFRK